MTIYQFLFIIIYTLFLFFSGGIYQTEIIPSILITVYPFLIFPLVLTYLLPLSKLSKNQRLSRFYFLLFSAVLLRIFIIIASPKPMIDVYTMLKEAPLSLLSRSNPYDTSYSQVYPGVVPNYFTYWPVSILLEIPFVVIFKDPRILFVLADLGSAFLIYLLGKKSFLAEILVLIFLFRPNSNFIIEQSWLAPLSLFLFLLIYYALEKNYRKTAAVASGLLVGIQPYYLLIILPLFFLCRLNKKMIASFISTLVLTVLPFFLINPARFLENTIIHFLRPGRENPAPVYLSLNLNTFIHTLTNSDIPFLVSGSLLLLIILIITYKLWRLKHKFLLKSSRSDYSKILLGVVIFSYSFYFLFRQAFINYYYFATGLIILWLVTKRTKRVEPS